MFRVYAMHIDIVIFKKESKIVSNGRVLQNYNRIKIAFASADSRRRLSGNWVADNRSN